jgi:hypothetical protein
MSKSGAELSLRDEIARLQQVVQAQHALLVQQQQAAAPRRNRQPDGHHTHESIILNLVIPQFVGASVPGRCKQ